MTEHTDHHSEVHSNLDQIMHHTELPTTQFADVLDNFIKHIGNIASWLWILIVVIIMTNVTSRYVFGYNLVAFEELQWHLYAVGFLLGMSYTLQSDHHVRVDVLHERFSLKTQTWIELIGLLFILIPFIGIMTWDAFPYAYTSYVDGEVSQSAGGLPYRWILKFVVPISGVLLLIAAFARLLKCTALLFGFPKAIKTS